MRHGIKKIKFRSGKDANRMLVRKLVGNFLMTNHLVTTKQKAKTLQSCIERLVVKAKSKTEANRNFVLNQLANIDKVNLLFDKIAPVFKEKKTGFTRVIKLNQRMTDGAELAKIEWTIPVIKKEEKKSVSTTKKTVDVPKNKS